MSQMTYAEAINEALHEAMQLDSSVICYGLGVTDPKAVFGTTNVRDFLIPSKALIFLKITHCNRTFDAPKYLL